MKPQRQIELIKELAEEEDGFRLYEDYSGRGMYGARCYGVSCDDPTECIELAAAKGLRGAKWDNLGKGYIVYWPNASLPEIEGEKI